MSHFQFLQPVPLLLGHLLWRLHLLWWLSLYLKAQLPNHDVILLCLRGVKKKKNPVGLLQSSLRIHTLFYNFCFKFTIANQWLPSVGLHLTLGLLSSTLQTDLGALRAIRLWMDFQSWSSFSVSTRASSFWVWRSCWQPHESRSFGFCQKYPTWQVRTDS